MNNDVAKQYTQVMAIMSDLENGMYMEGTSISPNGDVGMFYVGGVTSIVRKGDTNWKPLKGYDMDQYLYEIIAYTSAYLEEKDVEMPKRISLKSPHSVEVADGYIKYIEDNIDEIYEIQKEENCNFSKAVFGKLYTDRRRKENEYAKANKGKEVDQDYYLQ